MKARVRLRDPEHYDSEGRLHINPRHLEWADVEYRTDGTCEHAETICPQCIDSWLNDHEVRL